MPYSSIEGAKKAGFPTSAEDAPLTLSQINKLADIYDSVKAQGNVDNPMAVAWTTWKKIFKKEGNKWVKVEKKEYDLPNTVNINNVEIFSSMEKPNGDKYTEKDLEDMVAGFYETKEQIAPYLKLGHDEKQKLAQSSGMPALGWVENLRKVGKKLIADFVKVPQKIYDLIKAGAYRKKSAEIFWNIDVKGKKYRRLLRAVSILGADTPACGDIGDIVNLYSTMPEFYIYENDSAEVKIYDFIDNKKKEEDTMSDVQELLKKNTELEEKLKKYEEEKKEAEAKVEEAEKKVEEAKTEAEAAKTEAEKANEELDKKKEEETKTEINSIADRLINEKHLCPADKDAFVTMLYDFRKDEDVKKYKIGDTELTREEILISVIEKNTIDINTETNSEIGKIENNKENAAIADRAEKYAKDHNVSYSEALIEVSE